MNIFLKKFFFVDPINLLVSVFGFLNDKSNAENLPKNNNLILAEGDIVKVKNSMFREKVEVFTEVTTPLIGFYPLMNIFK